MQTKDYNETIKKVMLWIMMADGVMDNSEVLQISHVYHKITNEFLDLETIKQESQTTDYKSLEKHLDVTSATLSLEHRLIVFKAAMLVAAADDKFQIEEQILISCLVKKLQLPKEQALKIINEFFQFELVDTVGFTCPTCERIQVVKRDAQPLGKKAKCKGCQNVFRLSKKNMQEQKACEKQDIGETVKKVLLWIMMADGVIEEKELLQVAEVYNKLTERNISLVDLNKEAKQTDYQQLEKFLDSAFANLNIEDRLLILTAAMSVAAADGEFQIEEQVLISCLVKKLRLSQKQADAIIKRFFDIELTSTVEFKCPACQRVAILKKESQPLGKQIKCKSCQKDFVLSRKNMDGTIAFSPMFYTGITLFFIFQLWISAIGMPQSKMFLSAIVTIATVFAGYFWGIPWIEKNYPHFWNSPTKYLHNRCSLFISLILLATTLGIFLSLGKMLLVALFLCGVIAAVVTISLKQKFWFNFIAMFFLWLFFAIVFSASKNTYHTSLFKEAGQVIENYESYLSEYPQGKFIQKARSKISRLRYEKVKSQNTLVAYREYLEQYPKSRYLRNVKQHMAAIVFKDVEKKNTIAAYKTFLQQYPEAQNRTKVEEKINKLNAHDWEWVKKQDKIAIYKMHLEHFPDSPNKKFIEKRIIDLEVDDISRGTYGSIPDVDQSQSAGTMATLAITNQTQYTLTIRYSGKTSKKVVLSPGQSTVVSLAKGSYRIAASVNAFRVSNYYGTRNITGSYSTRYYIRRN